MIRSSHCIHASARACTSSPTTTIGSVSRVREAFPEHFHRIGLQVMTSNFPASPRATWGSFAVAAGLAGCGGGGGTDASPAQGAGGTPTVATASAGSATYGKTLVLTLTGTNLDQGVTVSATGCDGVAIDTSSSGPNAAQY